MRSIRFEMIFEEINTTQLDVKFVLIMILEYFIPRLYQIQCKWDLIGYQPYNKEVQSTLDQLYFKSFHYTLIHLYHK